MKAFLRVELMGRGMLAGYGAPRIRCMRPPVTSAPWSNRQGLKVGCLKKSAWRLGWIDERPAMTFGPNHQEKAGYGNYLLLRLLS